MASLSPEIWQTLRAIGLIVLSVWLVLWLLTLYARRWRYFYIARGIYWTIERCIWDVKRLFRFFAYLGYSLLRSRRRHKFRRRRMVVQKNIDYRPVTAAAPGGRARRPDEAFRPWRRDYYVAFCLWGVGFVWMAAALLWFRQTQDLRMSIAAMLGVVPIFLGFSHFESGQSRKRGKAIEIQSKKELTAVLPDAWDILPDQVFDELGDIDVSLQFPSGEVCAIEIKSWNYWSGYVRKKQALRQVRRQARAIGAEYPVIWLPKARRLYMEFIGDVFIVSGPARLLPKRIVGIIDHDAVIRFPREPSGYSLSLVKALGFSWSDSDYSWYGRCCKLEAQEILAEIARDNGRVFFIEQATDAYDDRIIAAGQFRQ